jgi:chromosome segregation ATPase
MMADLQSDCGYSAQYIRATNAGGFISQGMEFMRLNAQTWANDSAKLASEMADFSIRPLTFRDPQFGNLTFTAFAKPGLPTNYSQPALSNASIPTAPGITVINSQFPTLTAVAPTPPLISIPLPPSLPARTAPTAPKVVIPEIPVYEGEPLPTVPTLRDLQLPEEPDIRLEDFNIVRPDFDALMPSGHLDNNYYADVDTRRAQALTELRTSDLDGQAVRARWGEMILGGTGLPIPIEQALFDRALQREEMSAQQAVNQAHQEWAARGFSLPGSTLLARVSEAHNANRAARAQINREVTIQYHNQEIENLRFAVQQGVALEAQWASQFSQAYELARQTADGFYRVAVAVLESRIARLRAALEIYQADIQAFRDRIQIELSKLEVFRSRLEAQRLIGDLNKLDVDIYVAQLQGVLAGVEVFKARVEGANAQIRAEVSKVDVFRGQVDGFRGLLESDKLQVDIFTSRTNAEEAKVRTYTAEVQGYAERVRAFSAEVQSESSRMDSLTRFSESKVREYATRVDAWRTQVGIDIERIRAAVAVFEAETGRYNAELGAETARVEGESRNTEIAAARINASVAATLKQADQQIEQLRHSSSLALQALDGAARTYGQLAAAALSAVNLSASIGNSYSGSESVSCATGYNYNFSAATSS